MRRISMGLLAIFVFLASCSTKPVIPNSSAATIGTHVMDQWIDPAIQGKEREIIRREIANVPAEERENFTFVDLDQSVYVNRPEIRGDLEWLHPVGDTGVYVDSAGNKSFFAAPPAKPSDADLEAQYTTSKNYDGCPVNRGAYRRVMTKEGCASGGRCSGGKYTRIDADVTLMPMSPYLAKTIRSKSTRIVKLPMSHSTCGEQNM